MRSAISETIMPFKKRRQQTFAKIKSSRSGFSGSHRSTKIHMLLKSNACGVLSGYYKRHRGRNNTGAITVYSKGRTFKKAFISYAHQLSALKSTTMALGMHRDATSSKVATLVSTATGELCYLPLTTRTCMLRIMFGAGLAIKLALFNANINIRRFRYCEHVSQLKFYSNICFIAIKLDYRVTLAKASGASATTLVRQHKHSITSTAIKLPSGQLKLIQSGVIVLLGVILPTKKKAFKNTRAGY